MTTLSQPGAALFRHVAEMDGGRWVRKVCIDLHFAVCQFLSAPPGSVQYTSIRRDLNWNAPLRTKNTKYSAYGYWNTAITISKKEISVEVQKDGQNTLGDLGLVGQF